MKKTKPNLTEAEILRQKAEELLNKKISKTGSNLSEGDMLKLFHELQVHEIELEMQNEELKLARENAEEAAQKYTELYDFAPSGYFTLSKEGKIVALNLKGASLLGKERQRLLNSMFRVYLSEDSRPIFNSFLDKAYKGKAEESCELILKTNNTLPLYVLLTGIFEDNDEHCKIIMVDISKNKNAESIINQNIGAWALNLIDKTTWRSLKHDQIFGYDTLLPDWTFDTFIEHVIPEDREVVKEKFENATATGTEWNFECRIFRKDSIMRWIWAKGNPNLNKNGEPVSMEGVVQDITERKKAENLLKERNQFLTKLTNSLESVVFTVDLESRNIDYVNDRVESVFGYSPDECIGNSTRFLYPDKKAFIDYGKQMQNAIQKNQEFLIVENTLRKKNGELFSTDITTSFLDKTKVVAVITDITDKKKTEQNLIKAKEIAEENESKFRNLFENSPIGKSMTGIDGSLLVNKSFCEIVGYSEEELAGQKWKEISYPEDIPLADEKIQSLLNEETHKVFFEKRYIHKNENIIWADVSVYLQRDKQNKPEYFITTIIDITERKHADKSLRSSQEMLLSSQSVANICSYSTNLNPTEINKSYWECSPEFYKIFGIDETYPHTIEGWIGLLHPEYRKDVAAYHESVVLEKKSFNREYKIIRINDGVERWVQGTGELVYDKKGNPIRMYGAIQDITERKQQELQLQERTKIIENKNKELIESEIKLKQSDRVFNLTLDMFCIAGFDGYFKNLNPAWERTLGWSIEELLSKPWLDFVHPDDAENTKNIKSVIVEGKEIYQFENRYICKDGSIKWLSWNSQPFPEENIMIGAVRDVTGAKRIANELLQAKNEAEENEKKFRQAFDHAGIGMALVSLEGKLVKINHSACQIWGYTEDELLNMSFQEITHPDDLKNDLEHLYKTIEGEINHYNISKRYIKKSGETIWTKLHVSIVRNNLQQPQYFISQIEDITKQVIYEQELIKAKEKAEENERKLIEAQELSHVGNWDYTIDTDTVTWSKELYKIFERQYDLPAPQYSEQRSYYTKESFALLDKSVQDCLQLEIPYEIELDIITSSGNVKQIISRGKAKKDKNKKIIGSSGTAQDITQQKQIEQQLIKAKEAAENANNLKTEFLHNMSHEIRTPLNGILGFSEILNNPKIRVEKRKNYTTIIRNSGEQLLRVVDDILEISTLETKQAKLNETEFCLNDFLMELFSIFNLKSVKKDVPIYLEKLLHDKQVLIISDKTKLNKILSNLIENAIKFTNRGSVEIGYSVENELLKLYVKDTGIGISPENQQKIFERFSQEDTDIAGTYGGLGLGLSICKENAQLLGGDITLESKKGSGSTFIVTIPYKPAGKETPGNNKSTTKTPAKDKTKTILVAEDEEMNYMYIEALFEDELEIDCNLIHAKNGKEALDICLENQDIDLVLMDIKMPVMNGNEATQKIKKRFPDLPVIAQTAYSTESEKAEAMKHGYDDFISKPLDKETFFETINKYVKIK